MKCNLPLMDVNVTVQTILDTVMVMEWILWALVMATISAMGMGMAMGMVVEVFNSYIILLSIRPIWK